MKLSSKAPTGSSQQFHLYRRAAQQALSQQRVFPPTGPKSEDPSNFLIVFMTFGIDLNWELISEIRRRQHIPLSYPDCRDKVGAG